MLVNEQGDELKPPFRGEHWRVYMALRAEAPTLEKPLHEAIDHHVNEFLAAHPVAPARTIRIDSTDAGSPVLGPLSPDWMARFAMWLEALPSDLKGLVKKAKELYGMALAYHLAYFRSEIWEMSEKEDKKSMEYKTRRIYTLRDPRGT